MGLKFLNLEGELLKQKLYDKLKDSESEILESARHNKSIDELHDERKFLQKIQYTKEQ